MKKNNILFKKIIFLITTLIIIGGIIYMTQDTTAEELEPDFTYIATQPVPGSESNGLSASNDYGLEGPGVLVKTPLFLQTDKKWGSIPYGPYFDIAAGGCGPTSASMVVSALTEKQVEPPELAERYGKDHTAPNGSKWTLFPAVARDYGLKCRQTGSMDESIEHLKQGGLVIASMGPGHFTNGGHFIVLKGVHPESGKIYVNDPASTANSNKLWDPSIIENERSTFFLFSK